MGRGGRQFRNHWHDRQAELADGDVLRWMVVARPGSPPWIAYFRSDVRGGVHEDEGYRLLAELGHADAGLDRRGGLTGSGAFH